MARPNRKTDNQDKNILNNKVIKRGVQQLNTVLGQAELSLYGTDRVSDIDSLNKKFQKIMQDEVSAITDSNGTADMNSFLASLYSNDKKNTAASNMLNNQFMSIAGDDVSAMAAFIEEEHRNKLLEQSDLHEVASQLIELSEAILVTRDAIVTSEVVEGRMSRTLDFKNTDGDSTDDYKPVVEALENKFDLQNKIKNFIVPKGLEYGEYYVYVIPYSELFNNFMAHKDSFGGRDLFHESTLFESVSDATDKIAKETNLSKYTMNLYKEYCNINESTTVTSSTTAKSPEGIDIKYSDFDKSVRSVLENVTVSNTPVPIPILNNGFSSMGAFFEGTSYMTEADDSKDKNLFNKIIHGVSGDGGVMFNDSDTKKKEDFTDIKDCYIQMIDPTKCLPIKIMNKTLGYYYVQSEDISPLSGAITSTLFYSKFDENRKKNTIVDSIAGQIVKSFDKKFLIDNQQFKDLIVQALNYYNLHERKLKFQYIPVEYMQAFKINEDEDGNGQSMIKKSLFYAKLYLMLLMFKIMSIVLNSNDMKVNYIKSSGLDKNLANKVQEIARIRQSRQINMVDLFNYTTLINKVGNGSEMYVPTGRSGERPIETEILAGQDVQLNSDLLEMLKNAYILGTGVPAAIINYLNEADFAKVVEQNNTKYLGRVVNYQMDFNKGITELYKKIMKFSSNIPDNIIQNFVFTLQPPKTPASVAKSDSIQNFSTQADFAVQLFYGENQNQDPDFDTEVREFKKLFAKEQLPSMNIEKLEDLTKTAKVNATKAKLKPAPDNDDGGDDMGFDELDLGTPKK